MKVNGVRCDKCRKEHLYDPDYVESTPVGWFSVIQGTEEGEHEWLHFCSRYCVHNWLAREQRRTDKET